MITRVLVLCAVLVSSTRAITDSCDKNAFIANRIARVAPNDINPYSISADGEEIHYTQPDGKGGSATTSGPLCPFGMHWDDEVCDCADDHCEGTVPGGAKCVRGSVVKDARRRLATTKQDHPPQIAVVLTNYAFPSSTLLDPKSYPGEPDAPVITPSASGPCPPPSYCNYDLDQPFPHQGLCHGEDFGHIPCSCEYDHNKHACADKSNGSKDAATDLATKPTGTTFPGKVKSYWKALQDKFVFKRLVGEEAKKNGIAEATVCTYLVPGMDSAMVAEYHIRPLVDRGVKPCVNVYVNNNDSPFRWTNYTEAARDTFEAVEGTWLNVLAKVREVNAAAAAFGDQYRIASLVYDLEACQCGDDAQRKAIFDAQTLLHPELKNLVIMASQGPSAASGLERAASLGLGEIYWNIGDMWPCTGSAVQYLNYEAGDDTACTGMASYRVFKDEPEAFIDYLDRASKSSMGAGKPLVDYYYQEDSGRHTTTVPLLSTESLYTQKGDAKRSATMCPALAFSGREHPPATGSKICGTFDGFSYWSWSQYVQFMRQYASRFKVGPGAHTGSKLPVIGIYDAMFLPESWLDEDDSWSADTTPSLGDGAWPPPDAHNCTSNPTNEYCLPSAEACTSAADCTYLDDLNDAVRSKDVLSSVVTCRMADDGQSAADAAQEGVCIYQVKHFPPKCRSADFDHCTSPDCIPDQACTSDAECQTSEWTKTCHPTEKPYCKPANKPDAPRSCSFKPATAPPEEPDAPVITPSASGPCPPPSYCNYGLDQPFPHQGLCHGEGFEHIPCSCEYDHDEHACADGPRQTQQQPTSRGLRSTSNNGATTATASQDAAAATAAPLPTAGRSLWAFVRGIFSGAR